MKTNSLINSLLSARQCLSPQIFNNTVYFISNIGGQFSLYSMPIQGGFPRPLIPLNIALQNPVLIAGLISFKVLPTLKKILIMIDRDGDEEYKPHFIPIDGGIPEPLFETRFEDKKFFLTHCCNKKNIAYFYLDPLKDGPAEAIQVNLNNLETVTLDKSKETLGLFATNRNHDQWYIVESVGASDHLIYCLNKQSIQKELFLGKPLDQRDSNYKKLKIGGFFITNSEKYILGITPQFVDTYSFCLIDTKTKEIDEVKISGTKHKGVGELTNIWTDDYETFVIEFNIDGCSYLYWGNLDEKNKQFNVRGEITEISNLKNGVLQDIEIVKKDNGYFVILSLAKANSPSQLYSFEIKKNDSKINNFNQITDERLIGIPNNYLSEGEDASFVSHDGLRVSARLYLPPKDLGFKGKRPVIFYIHGGPTSQERPNFSWFSMPLIQYFILNGFAVFVPNVRGSTGYGNEYTEKVNFDWGGQDRLDHLHALKILEKDPRIDSSKRGVMGRSYGGYMTLTLISRHPESFQAGIDMFGPYDLLGFYEKMPEVEKEFVKKFIGDPTTESGRKFFIERSPKTYMNNITSPLLVIQGKNDPRVKEVESREVVEDLRSKGKKVEYLVFEDEGHDVIKFKNKVICYQKIVDFFKGELI